MFVNHIVCLLLYYRGQESKCPGNNVSVLSIISLDLFNVNTKS